MNYAAIVQTALLYADRADDTEVRDRMASFIVLVEARVNRLIQGRNQSTQARIVTKAKRYRYGLPRDYSGMRYVEIAPDTTMEARNTLQYVPPEYMNSAIAHKSSNKYYSIQGNTLIVNQVAGNEVLTITYYRKVPPLIEKIQPRNWVSDKHPDIYINGLMVEICAFVKDAESATLWDGRFTQAVNELVVDEDRDTWSGPAPRIRVAQ